MENRSRVFACRLGACVKTSQRDALQNHVVVAAVSSDVRRRGVIVRIQRVVAHLRANDFLRIALH